MNTHARNQMVVENLPLVGYIVAEVCGSANNLPRDDLASAGAIALIEIAESFDPDRGVSFGAYARQRLIGAIKDEMRSNDWAKRASRTRITEVTATQETLTAALGRQPTVDEIAGALGVSRESAAESVSFTTRTVGSLDTTAEYLPSTAMLPEAALLAAEREAYLRTAVQELPEKMRFIIEETFLAERTLVDVAAELGVTHSAVSQQRTEAIRLLRDGLNAHYVEGGEFEAPVSRVAPARRSGYLANIAARVSDGLELRPAIAHHA